MTEIKPSEYWLVRDPNNYIWGPITRKEVIDLLRAKKLRPKAEISQANSYWFQVDEIKEIAKFFPELADLFPSNTIIDSSQSTHAITKKIDGEWLSEEFAADFGYAAKNGEQTTMASREQLTPASIASEPQSISVNIEQDDEPTLVPIEDSNTDPTLNVADSLEKIRAEKKKRYLFIFVTLVVILGFAGWASFEFFIIDKKTSKEQKTSQSIDVNLDNLRIALLLNDISGAQEAINILDKKKEASISLELAKAIVRKDFLFDTTGAIKYLFNLKKSPSLTEREKIEVDNLTGIYLLETDSNSAIQYLQSAIRANMSDPVLRFNLAIAYLWQGNANQAFQELSNLKEKNAGNKAILPLIYLTLGQANPKNAEEYFTQALNLDPLLNEARILLAITQWKLNKTKEAEKNLQLFIGNLPVLRERLWIKNFRMADLAQTYSQARMETRSILSKSGVSELWLSVDGILSVLVGENREAEQAFDRALQMQPGSIGALTGISYLRLKEGREVEIESIIKDKSNQSSKNLAIQLLLAQSYLKQAKYIEAEQLFQQLTKTNKDLSFIWSFMGEIYLRMKKNDLALESFEKAFAINNHDISALRGLQQIHGNNKLSSEVMRELLPF